MTVYALNLFDVADRDEYLAYSKRSPAEVAKHGGRVVASGSAIDVLSAETLREFYGVRVTVQHEDDGTVVVIPRRDVLNT